MPGFDDQYTDKAENQVFEPQIDGREQQLIIAARNGDVDAFAELFHFYWRKLWTLCNSFAGLSADAEDIAQEALLKAWQKLHTFKLESRFAPWLFRIAVNICIDRQRSKDREAQHIRKMFSLDEPLGGDEDNGDRLGEQIQDVVAVDPAEEATLHIMIAQCWPACWSGLSQVERLSLMFIYQWGGTLKELGWMVGAKRIEPDDDQEARRRRQQSAHTTGKYHVGIALRKLEQCLSQGGLTLTSTQALQLLDEEARDLDPAQSRLVLEKQMDEEGDNK